MLQRIILASSLLLALTLTLPIKQMAAATTVPDHLSTITDEALSLPIFNTQQRSPAANGVELEREINELIETLDTLFSTYRENVQSLVRIGKPAVPALLK